MISLKDYRVRLMLGLLQNKRLKSNKSLRLSVGFIQRKKKDV